MRAVKSTLTLFALGVVALGQERTQLAVSNESAVHKESATTPNLRARQFLSGQTTYCGGSLQLAPGMFVRIAITGDVLEGFSSLGQLQSLFSAPIRYMTVDITVPPSQSHSWWDSWGTGQSALLGCERKQVGSISAEEGELFASPASDELITHAEEPQRTMPDALAVTILWANQSALYCARFAMSATDAQAIAHAVQRAKSSVDEYGKAQYK